MRIDAGTQGAASKPIQVNRTAVEVGKPVVEIEVASKASQENGTYESYRDFSQKPAAELTLDEKQWIDVINRANKAIEGATCTFEYSIHEKTKEIMVKVIDKETKKVIREFPPENILDMVAKMWEMAGLIVDERR